jgi:trehalose/maltose hydrolase-like predicted phosphorylase
VSEWVLRYDSYEPGQEAVREALCTLGNGYFATRGAAADSVADGVHYPGTYLAGGYNRLVTRIADRDVSNEDLVNFPNWLPLTFRIDGGDWFRLDDVEIEEYHATLDMRQGTFVRRIRFVDAQGRRSTVTYRRFVSMADPHLAGIELTVLPMSWSGRVDVRSTIDARVTNAGVKRYAQLASEHLRPAELCPVDERTVLCRVETTQSRLRVAMAARTEVLDPEFAERIERTAVEADGRVGQDLSVDLESGQPLTVHKIVALTSSRDPASSECGLDAQVAIGRAPGFDDLLADHQMAWNRLWRRYRIAIEGPERASMIVHLHIFHMLQTVSRNTVGHDVGVPARGWHGEAYRGHVFWDELFIFPLLSRGTPEVTRTLLHYRFRRLPAAREAAAAAGYEGAMFPWQSGSDGREETQVVHLNPESGRWLPDGSHLQRHVNIAIAYNVWQYYKVTGDRDYMAHEGTQLLIEIAQFLASLATYNRALDRFEIIGVMGPDEYHEGYPDAEEPGLANNAYTNLMTVWVLTHALRALRLLPPDRQAELLDQLRITREDLDQWQAVSRKMRVLFHDGVISQFEGYDQLEEFDWEGYRARYGDIQRLDRILEAEGDSTDRYRLSKQADVLMLFYLLSPAQIAELFDRLGYPFDEGTIARTIDYYEARTSHGSTLSRVVHSWVLGRSDRERSWRLFTEALESDVADIQGGTTGEGIHLGAMAGTVDLVQRAFTGMVLLDDAIAFDPLLPDEVDRLEMRLQYRQHAGLLVVVTRDQLKISSPMAINGAPPVRIGVRGEFVMLEAGTTRTFDL